MGIHRGRPTTVEGIDELPQRASCLVEIVCDAGSEVDAAAFEPIDGVSKVVIDGDRLRGRLDGCADALVRAAAHFGVAAAGAARGHQSLRNTPRAAATRVARPGSGVA